MVKPQGHVVGRLDEKRDDWTGHRVVINESMWCN